MSNDMDKWDRQLDDLDYEPIDREEYLERRAEILSSRHKEDEENHQRSQEEIDETNWQYNHERP